MAMYSESLSPGYYLTYQRKSAGLTRTEVADRMHWPRKAISEIEEGRRIPTAGTVYKYLAAILGEDISYGNMYERFHAVTPKTVDVSDIRNWLESLDPETVVYEGDVPTISCPVTTYARTVLGFPQASSNDSGIYRRNMYDAKSMSHVRIAHVTSGLGTLMGEFDAARRHSSTGLTAREALSIIAGEFDV